MARWLYSLLLYLITPLIGLRLLWRGRKQREYLENLGERWGFYPRKNLRKIKIPPLIWLHAVSVGETRAAQPLVENLLSAYPDHHLLLTTMTPTGRETGRSLYKERVTQVYLPYDYPGATTRFLKHFSPQLGILMETEIWPNLLAACQRQKIPVILANARLSQRSARGYQRIRYLTGPALERLTAVAAQTAADAQRLEDLGAKHVEICGNLKFDVSPDPGKLEQGRQWRQNLGTRPVWLAASTREGEENLLLDIFEQLEQPDLLLLLVPRHPQRFDEVARLISARGLPMVRRSSGELPSPEHRVWLGDSMGEMAAYYRLADLAFIGGSLLPLGGQNLIEAAACGCPVLVGPYTFNFAQATQDALNTGAAIQVEDKAALLQALRDLLQNPDQRQHMAEAATRFSLSHQGTTKRTLQIIRKALPSTSH